MSSTAVSPAAFCSYCGYPPHGDWWGSMHRVCTRCEHGIVLLVAADAAPGISDLFVIVDPRLTVHAVSRSSEHVLAVDDVAVAGIPLSDVLVGDPDSALADVIAQTLRQSGDEWRAIAVQTVGDPVVRFTARLALCGPPRRVLLTLTPASEQIEARAANGDLQALGAGAPVWRHASSRQASPVAPRRPRVRGACGGN
jgi:hypothetical protein